jgi:serine O-acetyltransferase
MAQATWWYFRDPGFKAVVRYRMARCLYLSGLEKLSWLLFARTQAVTGAELPPTVQIGEGLRIPHPSGIVVGGGTVVGACCTLLQGATLGERLGRSAGHSYPIIGDNVIIGAGAKVLGRVNIGDGALVGANAVVISDIPPNAVAVGVPARPIASRTHCLLT